MRHVARCQTHAVSPGDCSNLRVDGLYATPEAFSRPDNICVVFGRALIEDENAILELVAEHRMSLPGKAGTLPALRHHFDTGENLSASDGRRVKNSTGHRFVPNARPHSPAATSSFPK